MATKLASLFIELGVRGDKLTAELSRTSKRTSTWAQATKKSTAVAKAGFASVTVAAGAATAALTAMYAVNADALDELGKTATKLGDTGENLQTLGLAAEYAGVGADTMYKNLERMTRRLGDAEQGSGEAAGAVDLLGLNIDELINLKPTEAFESIARALGEIENPARRASIAADLFGRDGISALNLTSDVLQQATADYEALGGAISGIEIQGIEAANDAMTRLGAATSIIGQRLTASMAPAVKSVADQLFSSATQSEQLERTLDGLVVGALEGFSSLTGALGRALAFIDGREEIIEYGVIGYLLFGKKGVVLGGLLGALADEFTDAIGVAIGDVEGDAELLQRRLEGLNKELELLESPQSNLRGLFGTTTAELLGGDPDELRAEIKLVEEQLAELGDTTSSAAGFTEAASSALLGLSDALKTAAGSFGGVLDETGNGVPGSFLTDPTALPSAANDPTAGTDDRVDQSGIEQGENQVLESLARQADAYLAFHDQRIEADAAANLALHDAEVARLEASQERYDTYFGQREQLAKQFEDTWTLFQEAGAADRLQILSNETSGALATLSQHSRKWFEINKAFGLANATVSIATGIAKALELPFPANLAAAATVALQGAAQIATINNAEFGQSSVTSVSGSASVDTASAGASSVSSIDTSQPAANESGSQSVMINVYAPESATEEQKYNLFLQSLERARRNSDVSIDDDAEIVVNYFDQQVAV